MTLTRTYCVTDYMIGATPSHLPWDERARIALTEETHRWRAAYEPLINRARLRAYEQRKVAPCSAPPLS